MPRRVLCLTGGASNWEITEMQVENLQLREHGLELVFLDGPFKVDKAHDPEVQLTFPELDWFDWVPPGSACDRQGFAEGVAHVKAKIEADGPFDGLFGFSMGALVAALVMDGASGKAGDPRFLLAACAGGAAREPEEPWALQFAAPSLHLIGAKDSYALESRQLALDCKGSTYEMADAGHELSMACLDDAKLQETVRTFLAQALEVDPGKAD